MDQSPIFSEVLVELEKWLRKWDLLDENGALKDATWVTDGVRLHFLVSTRDNNQLT